MDVREDSQIFFSCKASFGRLGIEGGLQVDALKHSKKSIFDKTNVWTLAVFLSPLKAQHILKHVKQYLTTNSQYIFISLLPFCSNTEH